MKKKCIDLALLLLFAVAVGFPGIRADNIEKSALNAGQQSGSSHHAPQTVAFAPGAGPGTLVRSSVHSGDGDPATNAPLLTAANRVSGLALVSASEAAPGWDTTPVWATTHGPWAVYGAHRDFFGLRLAALAGTPDAIRPSLADVAFPAFPVGDGYHGRAFVSPCGLLSFSAPRRLWPSGRPIPDGGMAPLLAPLAGPASVIPPEGAVWYGVSPSNTLVITWRGILLNRDTALAASAQCELWERGDFAFRVKLPEDALDTLFAGPDAPFRTAVQNAGGGEAFAWDEGTLALARSAGGIEIRGRGFAPSDPALPPDADTDGDGLTDAEEIFLHRTDPLRADTDLDSKPDGSEIAAGTDPFRPDTDGDGIPDGYDEAPLDPSLPPPAASGMSLAERILNCVPFTLSDTLDSDWDGWLDWQEYIAGTDPHDYSSRPRWAAHDEPSPLFTLTVTLAESLPEPAVLTVGGMPLILSEAGSWMMLLPEGRAFDIALYSLVPCAPLLTFTVGGAGTFVPAEDTAAPGQGPSLHAPSAPGTATPGGIPTPLGMVAQPVLYLEPPALCFHGEPRRSVRMVVMPPVPGTYAWTGVSGSADGPTATFEAGARGGTALFTAQNALRPIARAWCDVTSCTAPPEHASDGSWTNTWCDVHDREHKLCVCDNPGVADTERCNFHGQSVAVCLGRGCLKHKCAFSQCPKNWCHEHNSWKSVCADKHKGGESGGSDGGGNNGGGGTGTGSGTGNGGTGTGGGGGGGTEENGHVHDDTCNHTDDPDDPNPGDNGNDDDDEDGGENGSGNNGGTSGGGGNNGDGNGGGGENGGGGVYPPPEEPPTPPGGGGGGNYHIPGDPVGHGKRGVLIVNSDDDDLDGAEDRSQSGAVADEDDLTEIIPSPGCCPCKAHNGDIHYFQMVSVSPGLAVYTGTDKATPVGTGQQLSKGTPVYVEAKAPAGEPWAQRIVWGSVTYAGDTRLATNELTALRLDIRPDFNLDGQVDTDDLRAERAAASLGAWAVPARSGTVHRVQLTAELGQDVPGTLTLKLAGGGFRVWDTQTPGPGDEPLLAAPGANADPATATVERDSLPLVLYAEAYSNDTAVLTFSFKGSGDAASIAYADALTLKTLAVDIDVDSNNDGTIDAHDNDEDGYEEYEPGLLMARHDPLDQAEGAGGRHPVRLSPMPEGFSGIARLTKSGGGAVRLWDGAGSGASQLPLPKTWNLAQGETPPAQVWVDGTADGAVTLIYSIVRDGVALASDSVRLTVIPPASYAPGAGDFAAIWSPLNKTNSVNAANKIGDIDGQCLEDEIENQGWPNVTWYRDDTGDSDLNLGTCTPENYLNMRNAGVVCITASHGSAGYHSAVYAPLTAAGEALVENWCANRPGMACKFINPSGTDPGYYYAQVSSSWLQSNWKPSLDARRTITVWGICYSAVAGGALPSIMTAAGGRWRIGYSDAVSGRESSSDIEKWCRYMNGKSGDGLRRTAGAAFGDGSEYLPIVRMAGNPWTTLTPALTSENAWMPCDHFPDPGSSARLGKGWGCVVFDTYLDGTVSAASAIRQLSGPMITDVRWVQVGAGKRAIGFRYDKSNGVPVVLELVPDNIRNEGVGGGRPAIKRDDAWASGFGGWEGWSF